MGPRARVLVIFTLTVLSGCSGGGNLPEFTTEGVITPAGGCAVNPREFSDAESLGTYGEGACTVKDAWKISAMGGIRFSQPAIVNCTMANSFHQWIKNSLQPTAQDYHGSKVVSLHIAASYACRPRNGRSGAKLSEHGFGNAIDVAGMTLADGTEIGVERDYYGSKLLKKVRATACDLFMTVLGPGSDASHKDHLHFDLATRKSGEHFCH